MVIIGKIEQEICYNTRRVGQLEDPRITYLDNVCPRFEMRKELTTPKRPGSPAFLPVCGNCRWYSVQG